MSHYYTVRQTSASETEVIVNDSNVNESASPETKVTIVETVVETDGNGEALVNSSERVVTGAPQNSVVLTGEPVQLMGMASTLPSSNIFVNYPHTMWERDSEGNRIPVTVVKAENDQDDLLSQATSGIKTEAPDEHSGTTNVTTITIPAQNASGQGQVVLSPTSSSVISGADNVPGQRILVQKAATHHGSSGSGDAVPRPHVCEVCTKTFAKREHLTKHLRIHKNDNKRYSCNYCPKAFRDRYELVRHTRRHTEDYPFRCQECNKGFMRHERYMTHLRWHSGERPFLCNMCEKSFRDRSELNRHSRRHTGDLPYKCETCGKGFLRRERYVTHVRIHTGEKPFVCAVCSRGYRDRRELKKHQTTHNHSGQSAPIPGTGPVNIPPPNASNNISSPMTTTIATPTVVPVSLTSAGSTSVTGNTASVTTSPLGLAKTILVQQQSITASPVVAATPPTAATVSPNSLVTSNTVHLPSTPVPKELLNINGQAQVVSQRIVEPFNPANVQLPQSVQQALQSINDRVTKQQQQQQRQKQMEEQIQQQQTIIKTEPSSIITLQGSPNGGTGSGSGGNGPLFYYLMPGSVPYSLSGDGGTTVQVKTSDGGIATAQLVTVPSGSIQSIVQQSAGGSSSSSGGGNAGPATTGNSVNTSNNSTSWILDTSPSPSPITRNSM